MFLLLQTLIELILSEGNLICAIHIIKHLRYFLLEFLLESMLITYHIDCTGLSHQSSRKFSNQTWCELGIIGSTQDKEWRINFKWGYIGILNNCDDMKIILLGLGTKQVKGVVHVCALHIDNRIFRYRSQSQFPAQILCDYDLVFHNGTVCRYCTIYNRNVQNIQILFVKHIQDTVFATVNVIYAIIRIHIISSCFRIWIDIVHTLLNLDNLRHWLQPGWNGILIFIFLLEINILIHMIQKCLEFFFAVSFDVSHKEISNWNHSGRSHRNDSLVIYIQTPVLIPEIIELMQHDTGDESEQCAGEQLKGNAYLPEESFVVWISNVILNGSAPYGIDAQYAWQERYKEHRKHQYKTACHKESCRHTDIGYCDIWIFKNPYQHQSNYQTHKYQNGHLQWEHTDKVSQSSSVHDS